MADAILSKKLEPVLLSCHQGLSHQDIVTDCLEKAQALAQVGFGYLMAGAASPLPAAYLSALEDWLELGLKHCGLIGAHERLVLLKP